MEVGTFDVDGLHFFVRDDDGLWISVGVEFAMNGETGASGGGGDQVDDYAIADQRFGAPILGDEREQTVLDPCSTSIRRAMTLLKDAVEGDEGGLGGSLPPGSS